MDKQSAELKEISTQYIRDKKLWASSIYELQKKIKVKHIYLGCK